MKTSHPLTQVLIGAVLSASMLSLQAADTYLIDFNTTHSGSYPDSSTWNVYAAPGDVTGALSDSDGNVSSISISGSGLADSTGTGLYNNNGPAWVDATVAAGDFFWTAISAVEDTLSITFSGLNVGDIVSLDLFASRTSSNPLQANYEFSLDGTTWSGFSVLESNGTAASTDGWDSNNTSTQLFDLDENGGYEDGRYMSMSGVTLTGTTLQVKLTKPAASSYAGINAMQLTVIPEPSSLIMIGIGLGALVAFRKRKA